MSLFVAAVYVVAARNTCQAFGPLDPQLTEKNPVCALEGAAKQQDLSAVDYQTGLGAVALAKVFISSPRPAAPNI